VTPTGSDRTLVVTSLPSAEPVCWGGRRFGGRCPTGGPSGVSLIFGKCSFLNSVGIDSVVGQSGSPTCWRRHEVQNDGLDLRFISWPQCLGLAFVANTTVVRGHAARSAGLPVTRRRNVRGEDHPLGRGAAGPKLCASWCLATGGLSFAKTLSGGQVVDLSARIRRQSESHDHHPAVG